MSKSSTLGPWAATTRQGSWDWVVYSVANPNIEICQMFHDNTELNETGEANARLISAAPDMLAALKEVSEMFMARPDMVRAIQPLIGFAEKATFERAAAAIAKARGR